MSADGPVVPEGASRIDGPRATPASARARAVRFILLFGLVSLFADVTYEGARSITGPYLAVLGASAATVGLVAGFGEFVGYGLRLASGYLADRTGRYWATTILGYLLNMLAVPALALTTNWGQAAGLMVAERLGKAIRTPARDAMLAHATAHVGRGWGFGLHEALDQIGAVAGPLVVAGVLLRWPGNYGASFALLGLPAIAALAVLMLTRWLHPRPAELEALSGREPRSPGRGLPRVFWLYLAFVAVSVAGFAHFQLLSYHMQVVGVFAEADIPLLFALAMAVDALVALAFGRLYDRFGLPALAALPLLSIPIAPLGFSQSGGSMLAGMVLWGAVLGGQETVIRAAIADLTPPQNRAFAYGVFNTAYGASWFLGSVAMGLLYDRALPLVIAMSIALQLAALPVIALVWRAARKAHRGAPAR